MHKIHTNGVYCLFPKRVIPYKSLLVSLVTLFISISSIFAVNVYSQSATLSVNMENATLKSIFDRIERETDLVFIYNNAVVPKLEKKSTVSGGTVEEILDQALAGTTLGYSIADKQVVIYEDRNAAAARQVATEEDQVPAGEKVGISGIVTGSKGERLIGATVIDKSTNRGVITDPEGVYYIEVTDRRAVLEFEYLGYLKKEERIDNRRIINVSLEEEFNELEQVVVVGYGTQKRASVVGSIVTIEPERLKGVNRAVSNTLAGQLAGVIGVQRTGEPGSDGSSFWIRGISTFQGTGRSPLVLVDGIERTLDDMDPAEIESFSILKDAAASAVYGVRGANGVILINTKRGSIGKPKVDISLEQGFKQPTKLPKYIGSADYLSLIDEIREDAGLSGLYGEELIQKYRDQVDPELYPDVDWIDAISKNFSNYQRGSLTVSGGSEILRYAVVGSYFGENSILARDRSQTWDSSLRLNKYNVRTNVDIDITPTTILQVGIGGYLQEENRPRYSVTDLFNEAFETPPYVHPTIYSTGEIPSLPQRHNPWAKSTQAGFQRKSSSKIESTFALQQDLRFILPGLKLKGTFSFDRWSSSWVERYKDLTLYSPPTERDADGNLIFNEPFSYGGEFLKSEKKQDWGNKSTYVEANLTYDRIFADRHSVNAMLLYNQRSYDDGSAVPYRHQGFSGRLSYSYDYRYIAEFNFGYNGSENFAKNQRFGFFPSAALGWYMSEESFMVPVRDILSKVKFRASWGLVGSDKLEGRRFAYNSTITSTGDGKYKWGTNNDYERDRYYEGHFGIPNLTWETVEKINVGVEIGLFNDVDLQVDVFRDMRRDIFMQRKTIPTAAGFVNTPWANFGKVRNQGVEISLMYNKSIGHDWNVSVRGTYTYVANKIVEYDEEPGVLGTARSRTGRPVGQLYGLLAERLFTEDDFDDVANGILKAGIPNQTFSSQVRPGDIKYVDVDGDGAITTMDQTALGGTYDPQIVYGFGFSLRYRNIDFNCFFQGNGRTYRFIGDNNFIPSANGIGNFLAKTFDDRWTPENPRQDVFFPRASLTRSENNVQTSSWWLRNMSMLRLKDVEVGYTFPKKWMDKIGLAGMRLYARGGNLLTFSKFKLWDPEVDTATGAKYPNMKSLSFGLSLGF